MVPKLSARISVTVKVQLKKEREIKTTEKDSMPKLVTEDAMLETSLFSNAESMVDQTTKTTLLKLSLDAQANHGHQNGRNLDLNSELLLKVGCTERDLITTGDQ